MDDPGPPNPRRAALLKTVDSIVPTVPKKEPVNPRVRQQFASIVGDEVAFAAFRRDVNPLQRQIDPQHTEWKELVLRMEPGSGDSDFQGYRCPTVACPFKSSAEDDVRTHCLEDCEDKGAYNRMYEQDRAFRKDSITPKDPGRPSNRALMSSLEKKNKLIRDIVESATESLPGLDEDPVLYAQFRSTMYEIAEMYASNPSSNPLEAMATTLGEPLKSFDELEKEIQFEFDTLYQELVAEYESEL